MEHVGLSKKRNTQSFPNFDSAFNHKHQKCGPTTSQKVLAEKVLLRRLYTGQRIIKNCSIPNSKATFLVVFSPDGTKLASTNGNHNIHIISVTTKKVLKTLSGHIRTPWTLAFHPSNNNVLASGCLDGEVRVWNLEEDTCEVWQSPGQTVIASVTFHPKVKLLVIATYQDLYFWDWSTSTVLCRAWTENEEEKIRYVKFDSSGDKLITAIALRNNILSQLDAVSFREVYQYSQERDMFLDFQRIQKFLKTQIFIMRSSESNFSRSTKADFTEKNIVKQTIPYLCTAHQYSFHNFLDVDIFCPTEFSIKIMTLLKSNTTPIANFCERCYLCRYTWLYEAVFKLRLLCNLKNHICEEYRTSVDNKHVWNFPESRKRELMAENEDEANGLIENMLRYSFEHYARMNIAPHFARHTTSSVCSKCFSIDYLPPSPWVSSPGKAYSHSTTLRSDCFLNLCEAYNFKPEGSFTNFLVSFAEVYQFLPSLQQISTKEDDRKLNLIMTEWEYLYCKMLLISKIMEGDNELLLRNPVTWPQTSHMTPEDSPTARSSSTSKYYQTVMNSFNPSLRGLAIQHVISRKISRNNYQPDSSSNFKPECNLCKKFDVGDIECTSKSIKLLQRELDVMATCITHRHDVKRQRSRMENRFSSQFGHEIDKLGGALFRTIQTVTKFILVYLSTAIRELKKLLKSNFIIPPFNDIFREHYSRMFIFITKRIISFTNVILEFLCNFNYNIQELTKKIEIEYSKANSQNFLFADLFRERQPPAYYRNCTFSMDQEYDPVFDEEREVTTPDLSDDEFSLNTSEDFYKRSCEYGVPLTGEPCNSQMKSTQVDERSRQLSERGTVASGIYLTKHLRLLDMVVERWKIRKNPLDTCDLLLLQNVNMLFGYFYHRQITEDVLDHRYSYHPLHRLQMWDFSNLEIPNISSKIQNIVVTECKVHNDATIAISHDGTRVATLLSPNKFQQPDWLGIFSLEWKTLGRVLYAVSLNQIAVSFAVSLSFSPTDQHLVVGYPYKYRDDIKMADVIAVKRESDKWKDLTRLKKSLPVVSSIIEAPEFARCRVLTTINCIKWIPEAGQGLVLGNSAGEIKFVY